MYQLSQEERSIIKKIKNAYYMPPVLAEIGRFIARQNDPAEAWLSAFDHMHPIIVSSKDGVEILLNERKQSGKIKDVSQARKAVVGQIFPKLLIYIFLQNKIYGQIDPHIFITDRVKQSQFSEMTTIHVGDETQKPDMDILIYAQESDALQNCIIISLKTSLRERAGQTYKWKLLLEIAQSGGAIKEKYEIKYPSLRTPLVCFATVNFYDEINSPQHRGMFKFFDQTFIGKPVHSESEFIAPMSDLAAFVNDNLGVN